ncbi:MAG TPA: CCA tRNA nucleotidyltransferase [Candidatus Eisenbacteria bacterium]|nr:CCA tRNA nucleotidyltransferase [Candidatus Eisenbacteria bacterium]
MTPRELANSIRATLRNAGHQALLAGGCVRDLLLGREPIDYDVATDATPDQVMQLFPDSVAVGAQFGVVQVWREDRKVEVATFRADTSYSDGRHPDSVIYTQSPREDVQRRDFTINGLLMRPETGEVLDFVGGQQDLRAGVIRAIGQPDQRFSEDRLRLMRAVRFAARFHFAIEPETSAAIWRHANKIRSVSAERLRDELTKILTEGAARRGFELLDETGLLVEVLPEVTAMKGVQQPPQYHPEGDVWTHTLMMIEGLEAGCSATLAWGVLLHDVGKPPTFRSATETGDRIRFNNHVDVGVRMAEEICRRYRFSNEETAQILALIANHMRFKDVERMRASTLKRFVRLPQFGEHMALHRLDCLSSHRRLDAYEFVGRLLEGTPPEGINPPKLLTGNDLQKMGYQPGPLFREILRSLEDAQLEGEIQTREQAREHVKNRFREKGATRPQGQGETADKGTRS